MNRMTVTLKRQLVAQTLALAVMVFGLIAHADYVLTSNETWTAEDVATKMTGVIDLHGHTLTVPQLTGDATITDTTVNADYELLDSIQATGVQRIFTGVTIENNAELEMDFGQVPAGKTANKTFFALNYVSGKGAFNFCVQEASGAPYFRFYGGGGSLMQCKTGDAYTFKVRVNAGDLETGDGSLDLTEFTNGTPGTSKSAAEWSGDGVNRGPTYIDKTKVTNRELILFDGNETGKPRRSSCTFYRLLFKEGADGTKHTFVPVRQVSTGKCGILDLEAYRADPTTGFHGNAETGDDFTAGTVTNYLLTAGTLGELHVNVAEGTTANQTVTLSGNMKLVKEGSGTFVAQKKGQTYVGGTEVLGGTFQLYNDRTPSYTAADRVLGALGSTVEIGPDGMVEISSTPGLYNYNFVLSGGKLSNNNTAATGNFADSSENSLGRIELTADSSAVASRQLVFATGVLDLGGHTLTVGFQNTSKTIYFHGNEGQVVRNGTIAITGGTNAAVFYDVLFENGDLDMRTASLDMVSAYLVLKSNLCVSNYIARASCLSATLDNNRSAYPLPNPGDMSVYGTFQPWNDFFYGCTLQNGATLDLSKQTNAWSVTSTGDNPKKTVTFADGATVTVKLGARTVAVGDRIVSWESKPGTTVMFKLDKTEESAAGRDLEVRDDGLYLVSRLVARATWTGKGDPQNVNDPGNWTCLDADDAEIPGGVPSAGTVVTLPDGCTNSFPVGGAFLAREVVLPATLGADNLDWSGITAPFSGTLDLKGRKLTLSQLTGDATITDTATNAEYELLDSITSNSSKNQYIKTGMTVANNVEYVLDFGKYGYTRGKSNLMLLGLDSGYYNSFSFCQQNKNPGGDDEKTWFLFAGPANDNRYLLEWTQDHSYRLTVDAKDITTGTGSVTLTDTTPGFSDTMTRKNVTQLVTTNTNYPLENKELALFGRNNGTQCTSYTLYRFWFKEASGTEASGTEHTFVPVRQLSTGKCGILDLATNAFHGNANTATDSGDFTAGTVTNYIYATGTTGMPGELHLNVTSGTTNVNTTVTLSGALKLVKEGAGAFTAAKPGQIYFGGTEVAAGLINLPVGDTGATGGLGLPGGAIRVAEGATLDVNGNTGFKAYSVVLAGGTLRNGTAKSQNSADHQGTVGRITLEADSTEGVLNNLAHTDLIDLNGHTLTVNLGGSGQYYILKENGSFTNGTVDVTNGGWFRNNGGALDMRTVNMRIKAVVHLENDVQVNDLALLYGRGDYGTGNGRFLIYGTYKAGNYHRNCELQDGATLDLGGVTDAWPVESTLETSTSVTFATNATVTVSLGGRKAKNGPIVTWQEGNVPDTSVNFALDPALNARLIRKENGLWLQTGLLIRIR